METRKYQGITVSSVEPIEKEIKALKKYVDDEDLLLKDYIDAKIGSDSEGIYIIIK